MFTINFHGIETEDYSPTSGGLLSGASLERGEPHFAAPRSTGHWRDGYSDHGEGEINITKEPLRGSKELLEELSCRRSPKRPIPVPRSMLRFLAENPKPALTKTIIGYVVRGLSISRDGVITGKGTVKVSWIADTFDLSERAVRYARRELVEIGWISRDTGSHQLKLNRDGAYFVINPAWTFVNRKKEEESFAPPPVQTCTAFAPLIKTRKLLTKLKTRKLRHSPNRVGLAFIRNRNRKKKRQQSPKCQRHPFGTSKSRICSTSTDLKRFIFRP